MKTFPPLVRRPTLRRLQPLRSGEIRIACLTALALRTDVRAMKFRRTRDRAARAGPGCYPPFGLGSLPKNRLPRRSAHFSSPRTAVCTEGRGMVRKPWNAEVLYGPGPRREQAWLRAVFLLEIETHFPEVLDALRESVYEKWRSAAMLR